MADNLPTIVQGCIDNDNASWGLLLQSCTTIATTHHRKKFKSLSPEDSENIISNIYTKLVDGGLSKIYSNTHHEILGYLKMMAQTHTTDYFRHNSRWNSHESLDQNTGNGEDSEGASFYDFLESESLSPETIVGMNDLYRNAMGKLSVRDKQIMVYKIEGYKDKEIAELLGIPMNTVASSYNRMREMLQRTLAAMILIILLGRKFPWPTS